MGVQKRRVSHARQGDRRSHHALSMPHLEPCPHCKEPKQVHYACPKCGWYGGREAVRLKPAAKPEQSAP